MNTLVTESGTLNLTFISLIRRLAGKRQLAFNVKSNLLNSYLAQKVGYSFSGSILKLPSNEYCMIFDWPICGYIEITFDCSNSGTNTVSLICVNFISIVS